MAIGINDLDFLDDEYTTTQDINDTDDFEDTPLNENPVEQPETQPTEELTDEIVETPNEQQELPENVLHEFLKSKGIVDVSKIKYENEEGVEEEISWDSLDANEQLAILNQLTSSDLDASELELIQTIRNSKMTPAEFLDYNVQAGVQRYVQNTAEQEPSYEIDQFNDDEIWRNWTIRKR